MLLNIKAFTAKLAKNAVTLIKKNIAASVSCILTVVAILLTVVCSSHTVNVFDGKKTFSVKGSNRNIEGIIATLPIDGEYEVVSTENGLFSTNVKIEYLVPLTVKFGNETSVHNVRKGTLAYALEQSDVVLDEYDKVSLSLDYYVGDATTVKIDDVEYVTETKTEAIPYGSEVIYSSDYAANTSSVTAGKAGVKTVTCSVKYVNGVAVETTVLNETVTEYAIDSTTIYGTGTPQYAGSGTTKANSVSCISTLTAPDSLLLDSTGKPVKFTSKKTLRATAYTHTGNNCSTGVYPQPGYVAVDPKEIPYGTKMYIVSADGKYVYGYAIAADTGGFIYGNRTDMDLFFDTESECVTFGRRNITVYFID